MYAIIVTGGKQYRVDRRRHRSHRKADAGGRLTEVKFDQVLAIGEGGFCEGWRPVVEWLTVTAKRSSRMARAKKLEHHHLSRKHSARRMPIVRPFARIEITAINGS